MHKRCHISRSLLAVLAILYGLAVPALAEGSLFAAEGSLVQARHPDLVSKRNTPSLFLKAPQTGLFAPSSRSRHRGGPKLRANTSQLAQLRALIQSAESRQSGYDAVQHGARIKPAKLPTRMSLAEINTWIDDTPGQPHAIGRYQFIPSTLRRLVKRLKLSPATRFSPSVQDQLADILLDEAGLNAMRKGQISRDAFMHNLSKIWAGLPSSNGKSYYHGHAGNKASITLTAFRREMTRIFPG